MIFSIKQTKAKEIEKMYNKSMKELESFFGFNWTENKPIISIVYDRKTFDILMHTKTENWVAAWTNGTSIYLLDGKKYKTESCHKYSKKRFSNTLKHELAHAFTFVISSGRMNPIWLVEGVAEYASGKKISPTTNVSKFLDFYYKWGKEGYQESYCIVKALVEKFGKEKLLGLLKSLKNVGSPEDFNNLFKKIYGFIPSYENFNKLLK